MLATTERLPDWPPPPGKIGIERAKQYIAWIKHHAPALIAAGSAEIRRAYPYASVGTSSHSVARLAEESATQNHRLCIGSIRGDLTPRGTAVLQVWITADGRLELVAGQRMRGQHPRMR